MKYIVIIFFFALYGMSMAGDTTTTVNWHSVQAIYNRYLTQEEMKNPDWWKNDVCDARMKKDTLYTCYIAERQAIKEHDRAFWGGGSMLLPFLGFAVKELIPAKPDNNLLQNKDCFIKKENELRTTDIWLGSVIGIIALIWWGLIIF